MTTTITPDTATAALEAAAADTTTWSETNTGARVHVNIGDDYVYTVELNNRSGRPAEVVTRWRSGNVEELTGATAGPDVHSRLAAAADVAVTARRD
jgi:hypothetical protein